MWRALFLGVLLSACAAPPAPWPGGGACADASGESWPLLLRLREGERQQTLQLHRNGDTRVALNGVGAPQFTARGRGPTQSVTTEPAYRGPDPQWLLWGLAWWQQREQLGGGCAPRGEKTLRHTDRHWTIVERGRTLWRWDPSSPARFELPARSWVVEVRSRENEH